MDAVWAGRFPKFTNLNLFNGKLLEQVGLSVLHNRSVFISLIIGQWFIVSYDSANKQGHYKNPLH